MKQDHTFLDLPNASVDASDVIIVSLPYEGTVSYGSGTSLGPASILEASTQVELWDEELNYDLDCLNYHTASTLNFCNETATPQEYLNHVFKTVANYHQLKKQSGKYLIIGVGGEHGLTPALVKAAAANPNDFSDLTVIQIDAHADLRDEYEASPESHACAMRRLVEKGASLIAIGIRSADREEFEYGVQSGKVETFFAQQLKENSLVEDRLIQALKNVKGSVYLTIDVDGLETCLSPATGTPQPGGLGWWQVLSYLRALLHLNVNCDLIGADIVETVPQSGTQVNEFTSARLLCKVITYYFHNKVD